MEFKIEEPDKKIRQEIKANWDRLAKPLDGLGEFEGLLARIGAILGSPEIDIAKKAVIVMCADNGVVAPVRTGDHGSGDRESRKKKYFGLQNGANSWRRDFSGGYRCEHRPDFSGSHQQKSKKRYK